MLFQTDKIIKKTNYANKYQDIKQKNLQLKILVDSKYTYTEINKQLVKEEKIKMEPIDRSFKVFNVDGTKNREVT